MLVAEISQMLLDVAEDGALPAICDSSFSSFWTTMAVKRSIKFGPLYEVALINTDVE